MHGYFYSEETRKGRFCGAKFKASGGRFESPRACRPRQQVGRVSSSPPKISVYRWCTDIFIRKRLEKDGFAVQNSKRPGDGLKVRVRADRDSRSGESHRLHQKYPCTDGARIFLFGKDSKRTVLLKYQILLPQPEQNLAEPSTSFPQFGQCLFCSTLVPQTEQNRSLSDNSAPQLVQIFAVDG